MTSKDTIFALSSGAGAAGVAVVRVSGPNADPLLGFLGVEDLPEPRHAVLRRIGSLEDTEAVDIAFILRFPGPASFTGEDIVELHAHGGEAVLAALFARFRDSGLVRMAEPGEFTRRAFENGKLDLTAAEGIGDLVAAQTEAQRKLALKQYDGGLAEKYDRWRQRLVDLLGHAEAGIDFSDEELPEGLPERVVQELSQIKQEIVSESHTSLLGQRIRSGFPIAILGAPNVGKSTILNRVAREEVAIVSETAGTTRDVIEVRLDLDGYAVSLSDTAGIRETDDAIEAEGVRRAMARKEQAALKLVVLDASADAQNPEILALVDGDTIVVWNKLDLVGNRLPPLDFPKALGVLGISAVDGAGVSELVGLLTAHVGERLRIGESTVPTRERHRVALEVAADALGRAQETRLPELVAEDIRVAVRELGRITGRVDIDEVLDTIFRDFCIGK